MITTAKVLKIELGRVDKTKVVMFHVESTALPKVVMFQPLCGEFLCEDVPTFNLSVTRTHYRTHY